MGSAWVEGWRDEQRVSHGELMSDREQVSGGDSQEEGSARWVKAQDEDEREGVPAWEQMGGTQGWRGSDAVSHSGRSSRSCPGGRPPRRSCRRHHMFRDNVSPNLLRASDSSINLLFSWLKLAGFVLDIGAKPRINRTVLPNMCASMPMYSVHPVYVLS